MVIEHLFKEKWIQRRPIYSFFLGIIFTIIAFITSYVLFNKVPHLIGISTILFIVILALYGVNKLFDIEEKIEAKPHKNFFREHKEVIDFFLYFFIGVFLTFFLISMISPDLIFSEKSLYIKDSGIRSLIDQVRFEKTENIPLPPQSFEQFESQKYQSISNDIVNIFSNNLYVMILSFFLSLFYSSGALFLITFNASIFASTIADVILGKLGEASVLFGSTLVICNLAIIFFHMMPEIAAYVMAAIAGGILSKAFIREKLFSKKFKRVIKDSFLLLLISIILLLASAIMEITVSKRLLVLNACQESGLLISVIALTVVLGIILVEWYRKNYMKK